MNDDDDGNRAVDRFLTVIIIIAGFCIAAAIVYLVALTIH